MRVRMWVTLLAIAFAHVAGADSPRRFPSENISADQFRTYLGEVRAMPGADIAERNQLVIIKFNDGVIYVFTAPGHPAHPGIVKRELIKGPDGVYMQRTGYFAADRDAFTRWWHTFDALDQQVREDIARSSGNPVVPSVDRSTLREFDIPTLETLGRELYIQDKLIWKAIDLVKAHHLEFDAEHIRGWIIEWLPTGHRFRFVRDQEHGSEIAFDILFVNDDEAQFSIPENTHTSPSDLSQLRVYELAVRNVPQPCSRRVNVVMMQDPQGDTWLAWTLAMPMSAGQTVVGGHYRFSISASGSTILKREALSTNCLMLQQPPQGQPIPPASVSFTLADTPVETHVYLSLLSGKPLYVTTAKGIWEVNKGKISFMKQQPGK